MLRASLCKAPRAQTSLRGESGEKFRKCFAKVATFELSPEACLEVERKESAGSKIETLPFWSKEIAHARI